MTKITNAQLNLLTRAAASESGLQADEKDKTTIAALIKRGLLISVPCEDGTNRLMITEKGRAARTDTSTDSSPAKGEDEQAPSAPPPRTTKIGLVVKLLCRREGATLAHMIEATGWQAHSVRGALSGAVKKDLGLNVVSEKTGAERVYRIVTEARS